jgi:alpha-2-macroglobulin
MITDDTQIAIRASTNRTQKATVKAIIRARVESSSFQISQVEETVFTQLSPVELELLELKSAFVLGEPIVIPMRVKNLVGQPVNANLIAKLSTKSMKREIKLQSDNQGMVKLELPNLALGQYNLTFEWVNAKNVYDTKPIAAQLSFDVFATNKSTTRNTLAMNTDRLQYRVGETANITVRMPRGAQNALITLETDEILRYEIIRNAAPVWTWRVPITEEMRRNAFVKVSTANGTPQFAEIRLNVSNADKTLRVFVKPNQSAYGIRESGTLELEVQDSLGRGVAANLSLALVDEGVHLLRPAVQNPMMVYNPRAISAVISKSSVHLKADSRGVVYLMAAVDNNARVASQITQSLSQANPPLHNSSNAIVRQDLPDTALWLPNIKTDSSGKATIKFKLPDNITTWRFTIIASSREGQFGSGRAWIRTSQGVTTQLLLPRYLLQGDEAEFQAKVFNGTTNPLTSLFTLISPNLFGGVQQTLTVEPNTQATISGTAQANTIGDYKVSTTFPANGLGDALEQPLSVLPRRSDDLVTAVGNSNSGAIKFRLRQGAIAENAKLRLNLHPSLVKDKQNNALTFTSWLLKTNSIREYPCAERNAMELTNALLLKQSNQRQPLKTEYLKIIDLIIPEALAALEQQQRLDGWWSNCQNYFQSWKYNRVFLTTSNVLQTMIFAKRQGLAVSDKVIQLGLKWLTTSPNAQANSKFERSHVLLTLAMAGQPNVQAMQELEAVVPKEPSSLAHLGLAYLELKRSSEAERILQKLLALRNERAYTVSWNEEDYFYPYRTAPTRPDETAIVLEFIAAIQPNHSLIPKIVAYNWGNTITLKAALLLDQNRNTPNKIPIWLNGKALDLEDDQLENLRLETENTLEIKYPNTFYTFALYYNLEPQEFTPVETELKLTRTYEKIVARENGAIELKPMFQNRQQLEPLHIGDQVLVTLEAKLIRGSLVLPIIDPLPAGLRPVNPNGLPLNDVLKIMNLENPSIMLSNNFDGYSKIDWQLKDTALHFELDNRNVKGHQLRWQYVLQAQTAGRFTALPTYNPINPDGYNWFSSLHIRARTNEVVFQVTQK